MQAYKCDMCGKYVDDAYSLDGICKPDLSYYQFTKAGKGFQLCTECFLNIMLYIYEVRKNYGLEE